MRGTYRCSTGHYQNLGLVCAKAPLQTTPTTVGEDFLDADGKPKYPASMNNSVSGGVLMPTKVHQCNETSIGIYMQPSSASIDLSTFPTTDFVRVDAGDDALAGFADSRL